MNTFYDDAWGQWNDMILYGPAPRLRRRKIISWLLKDRPVSVLDVGCGNGEFIHEARAVLPRTEFLGTDLSDRVIESNRLRFPDVKFQVLDLDRNALDGRFEAVVCTEVLEHCSDYEKALKRLADMTGSRLYISVPCGPVFEIDRRVGHTRHFSSRIIADSLDKMGMKMSRIEEWGFPFFNLYKLAINLFPDAACRTFLSERRYTWREKFLANVVYALFRASVPYWGYQLIAVASRPSLPQDTDIETRENGVM